MVAVSVAGEGVGIGVRLRVSPDNATWVGVPGVEVQGALPTASYCVVPAGWYYRAEPVGATISAWIELK